MKVLLVLDSLVPGGAERSTVSVAPHLLARGYELEFATLHDRPGLQAEVEAMGCPLHVLAGAGGWPGWVQRLRGVMAERRPDLVHTSLYLSDVLGRTAAASRRIPVVTTLPSEIYGDAHLNADHLRRSRIRLYQALDMATARAARRLHAVSHHVADTMATNLRYPRDRIDVVHRGRPAALATPDPGFDAGALLADLGLEPGRPVLLVVARHEPAKGIDRAIAALPPILADHPQAHLLVAGRPTGHTPALERQIDELDLGGHVSLLGNRSDVAHLLRLSDVFLLPSLREGLPGALLEAMAVGTPAVVNDIPQVREVAGEAEAIVVDAARPELVADGVRRSLADGHETAERVDRARDRFLAHFTMERAADGMAAFYDRSSS